MRGRAGQLPRRSHARYKLRGRHPGRLCLFHWFVGEVDRCVKPLSSRDLPIGSERKPAFLSVWKLPEGALLGPRASGPVALRCTPLAIGMCAAARRPRPSSSASTGRLSRTVGATSRSILRWRRSPPALAAPTSPPSTVRLPGYSQCLHYPHSLAHVSSHTADSLTCYACALCMCCQRCQHVLRWAVRSTMSVLLSASEMPTVQAVCGCARACVCVVP